MTHELDYYDILGLPGDATPEEIRRSFRGAALRFHPDVNQAPGETELFLTSQKAYEVLSDPLKRAQYDQSLSHIVGPVSAQVLYSCDALPVLAEPQLVYVLMELSVQKELAKAQFRPPLNLCLLLDRSTSMRGERMDMVRSSAVELVRQTGPGDTLSIVAFSDRAEVILRAGEKPDRHEVEERIYAVKTGGGTEILQGLQAALAEVSRHLSRSQVNHIILLTDGRTYGDEDLCLQIAGNAVSLGIGITALGIGGMWNDAFLDHLATMTGGRSQYISDPKQVRAHLQQTIQHLGETYAEQVIFQGLPGQFSELSYVFRLFPETTPLPARLPLRLGSLPRQPALQSQGALQSQPGLRTGPNLSVLFEFRLPANLPELARISLAFGKLVMAIPGQAEPIRLPVHFSRPVGESRMGPPDQVLQAMRQVSLYRLQERARQEVGRGEVERASWRLSRLAAHLANLGQPGLAATVLDEAGYLSQRRTYRDEGDKQIKYSTRGLFLPPGE